jgi:hypothetical protein
MVARFLPQYPKRIQVTDGLTKREANGVITLGFDYENSEFGAELKQAVDSTAADAVSTAADRTATEAAKDAAEAARDIAVGATTLFDTFAQAQTYAPATAPNSLTTKFYDTDQVQGSGATYRKNGTTSGDLVITLSDGTTHAGYDISDKIVNAASFGLSASKTAAQNMAILKTAIARTATNGRLIIPDLGGVINVDTSGGLSGAATIDRKMTVQIDGNPKATYSAYEANPAYMFNVTAHNVSFIVSGVVEGDGNILIGAPDGSTSQMPGLVYVNNVKGFRWRGGQILRQPMIGIHLAGSSCLRARLSDIEFMGGPASFHFSFDTDTYTIPDPDYVGSAYFGIVATGGGDHTFSKLHFTKDEFGGGRVINGIFTSGYFGNSNGNKTLNCIAYAPWEKLLYGYGDNQLIAGNSIYGAYGACHTEAIRIWGSFCTAYGNFTNLCRGGMQVLDGRQNNVFGNRLLLCRSTGVNVQHFSADYFGGIDLTKVNDNIITWAADAPERRFAIRFLSNNAVDMSGCEANGNTINGFGSVDDESEFAIQMTATAPRNAYNCTASRNNLSSYGNGIKMTRCNGGEACLNEFNAGTNIAIDLIGGTNVEVAHNHGKDPGSYFLSIGSGSDAPTDVRFLFNKSTGATNIAIRNHTFDTNSVWGEGNQWTSKPLVGGATLASGAGSSTITHGGIAPHATIMLTNTTQAAATKEAAVGFYASPATNDLAVATGDGSNFGTGVGIRYRVIQ